MKKLFIKNRKGQKISVVVEGEDKKGPLVFVMHGLGSSKESVSVQARAEAFFENNFTVVLFDTTNTYGESDGDYADATVTNYYEDLEDVILWTGTQSWYREPFWLTGASLGGLCAGLFAETYPQKVAALAPIATVVSGELSKRTKSTEMLKEWERTGWRIEESASKPGLMKKLKWSYMVDSLRYNLLPKADMLTMPVLLVVGEYDASCPPAHQKILFDALPGPKEMHIIKGAKHTFIEPQHLNEVKALFDRWIKKYKNP